MKKALILILSLCFCVNAASEEKQEKIQAPLCPASFTEEQLAGKDTKFLEKFFIILSSEQKTQQKDGKLSEKPGKVLVIQKGAKMIIAFYQAQNDAYVLIDKPIILKDSSIPRADMHPEKNLPCLIAKKIGTNDSMRLFVAKGKTQMEPAKNTAISR